MQTREAPLDTINVDDRIYNDYMVTVNVSPNKFVRNKKWCTYDRRYQEQILLQIFNSVLYEIKRENVFNIDHRFELTKQGMVHLHFVCSTTEDTIKFIQQRFHGKLGMPKLDPEICCKYTRTVVSRTHAEEYITKEDTEVPIENLFLQHQK